jgi:hypothetical protein
MASFQYLSRQTPNAEADSPAPRYRLKSRDLSTAGQDIYGKIMDLLKRSGCYEFVT